MRHLPIVVLQYENENMRHLPILVLENENENMRHRDIIVLQNEKFCQTLPSVTTFVTNCRGILCIAGNYTGKKRDL